MSRSRSAGLAVLALATGSLKLGLASAGDSPVPALSTTQTTVYFLAADRAAPLGVRRMIDARSPYARQALLALLAGPSPHERQAGISSAIPPGTEVRSLSFRGHGTTGAVVDLSALPATQDGVERARVVTQIARTLIGVSGIERVWLRSDGRPWGFWSMEGGILDEAWSYDTLVGLDVGSAVPGTEAVTGDYFSAVP
jgi:spore germination protein GerM